VSGWTNLGDFGAGGATINAICLNGDYLYVGGNFLEITVNGSAVTNTAYLARFNLVSSHWESMNYSNYSGSRVTAIAVDNNQNVYVGCPYTGQQTQGPCQMLSEGTYAAGQWTWKTNVGGGLIFPNSLGPVLAMTGSELGVTALATDGTNIFVGGSFDGAYSGSTLVTSYNVIKWDGTAWHAMGTNGLPVSGAGSAINSMAVSGTNVFVAGSFFNDPPGPPFGLARFATSGSALETDFPIRGGIGGSGQPVNGYGNSLAAFGDIVYLGGWFDTIGQLNSSAQGCSGIMASNIAQWQEGHWSGLGCHDQGLSYAAEGIGNYAAAWGVAVGTNGVFVTGEFDHAQDVPDPANFWNSGALAQWIPPAGNPLCQGLVAACRFEDNALDSVGTNNGILFGDCNHPPVFVLPPDPAVCHPGVNHQFIPGEVGLCLLSIGTWESLNNTGEDDAFSWQAYVVSPGMSVPDSPQLNFGAGSDFSVEAWVKAHVASSPEFNNNVDDGGIYIADKGGYSFFLQRGRLGFSMTDTSGHTVRVPSQPLPYYPNGQDLRDGLWHHVAVSVQRNSPTGGELYVDGVSIATFDPTPASGSLTTTNPLIVGLDVFGPNSNYQLLFANLLSVEKWAAFDEVYIYNRALSACDVWASQEAGGNGLQCLPTVTNQLVVPNYLATNDFAMGSATLSVSQRIQEVYANSSAGYGGPEFPAAPMVIKELRFRPDYYYGWAFTSTVQNIEINLSTTSQSQDHLSGVFTENTGPDETTVFSGPLTISSQFSGPPNGPKVFDIVVPLMTNFVFDASQGNLLVDIRNYGGSTASYLSGANGGSDSGSRVVALSPYATSASFIDSGVDALEILYEPGEADEAPPVITSQPSDQTVLVGDTVTFSVAARGSAPLFYHWLYNGAVISNATAPSFSIPNVQASAAGPYSALVGNLYGAVTSSVAVLTVNPVGASLVVPNYLSTNDFAMGSATLVDSLRIQEVYANSSVEFGGPEFPGKMVIQELRFRPDSTYGSAFNATINDIQVSLSTTTKTHDQLSATFADNVGLDATVVFSGSLAISSLFTPSNGGPKNFDIIVPLTTPFTFDPAAGDLLLDIRNFSGSSATYLSGAEPFGGGLDSGSRAVALNPDASSALFRDSGVDALEIIYSSP